ncbi:MAG: nucleoside deaminase [Candidatus Heimdallarchaeota archaeon]|nr:nucleoside deaminase [Candidatus Heimdallarchaeota archaeon]
MEKYDRQYLDLAIREAKKGLEEGGIPIGSVIVLNNKVIGRGHNRRIQNSSPLIHAEIDCLINALKRKQDLKGGILYSTHMPCYLCSGAIIQFGISRVVAGESKTFPHAKWLLECRGIEVVDLEVSECEEIIREYILEHKENWLRTSKRNTPQLKVSD